jgi:hypothetical protein
MPIFDITRFIREGDGRPAENVVDYTAPRNGIQEAPPVAVTPPPTRAAMIRQRVADMRYGGGSVDDQLDAEAAAWHRANPASAVIPQRAQPVPVNSYAGTPYNADGIDDSDYDTWRKRQAIPQARPITMGRDTGPGGPTALNSIEMERQADMAQREMKEAARREALGIRSVAPVRQAPMATDLVAEGIDPDAAGFLGRPAEAAPPPPRITMPIARLLEDRGMDDYLKAPPPPAPAPPKAKPKKSKKKGK